jgi:hypothetical protein
MPDLPEYLVSGDEARLIPVGASSQRERFACSVLLASLRVVRPFARAFFEHMNLRAGSSSAVLGYTEPVFRRQSDGVSCRPDGLLVLDTGRKKHRLIVETKIGSAKIDTVQLAEYARLARANDVDTIVTVSNELSADPSHLPYQAPREIRNTTIFHWSWSSLVMLAELLLENEDFDQEQGYILNELIRFFDHESAGVSHDTHMCSEWSTVVGRIQEDVPLGIADTIVASVVQCWHQRLASVCISQTRRFRFPITLRLSNSHWDQHTRLTEDIAEFVANNKLWASFEFPTQAGVIELVADAKRRNIACRMRIDAPLNRQTYRGRVKWLLNQLPEDVPIPARLDVIWERSQRSSAPLSSFREDLYIAHIDSATGPRAFDLVYVADLANRFAGSRTFVPAVEEAVVAFYENLARHIRPWQPPTDGVAQAQQDPEEQGTPHGAVVPTRQVVQRGQIYGRAFSIFNDGSIEIETASGTQQFANFAQLQAAAARNGRPGSIA